MIINNWRPVIGWEGLYEVSDQGEVRRIRSWRIHGGLLKGQVDRRGYLVVNLRSTKHVRCSRSVHRLVAAAFIGPLPDKQEVNHKDGVKTNNVAKNLEYVTHRDNVRHAHALGLVDHKGEKAGGAIFRNHEVLEIRRRYAAGETVTELSTSFRRPDSTIGSIVHRDTWKHI